MMARRGRRVSSAAHSAVHVLPTPGEPCRRKMRPSPLFLTKSDGQGFSLPSREANLPTMDWTVSLISGSRTRYLKASWSGVTSLRWATRT